MPETETVEKTDIPIRSPYKDVPVNGSIILYEGPLHLKSSDEEITGQGSISLNLQRDPQIRFGLSYAMPPFIRASTANLTIPTDHTSSPAKVHIEKFGMKLPAGTATVSGFLEGEGVTFRELKEDGKQEPVGRIQFHLINFLDYHGTRLAEGSDDQQVTWFGRAVFPFGPWIVTLDQFKDTSERLKEAKDTHGYALTHTGVLHQKDNKLFSPDEGLEVLGALHWLLSFMNGAHCSFVLPVGMRYLDKPLWQHWCLWKVSPPPAGYNWFSGFSELEGFAVADLFYQCWKDKSRRDWLISALGLYFASNRNSDGIELALANSQIALEMLTWVALLEENSLMSEEAFEKLPAADKLRALLFWLGVSRSVPFRFPHLKRAAKNSDAPQTVVEIRNLTIHQTRANRAKLASFSNNAIYEAWQLNLGYIELTLLKLLGYSSPYNDRIGPTIGDRHATLPWLRSLS